MEIGKVYICTCLLWKYITIIMYTNIPVKFYQFLTPIHFSFRENIFIKIEHAKDTFISFICHYSKSYEEYDEHHAQSCVRKQRVTSPAYA